MDLLYWVVWHEGLRDCTDLPVPIADLRRLPESVTLGSLRCSCMASLVPGVEVFGYSSTSSANFTAGIETNDLAVASNGYVAWLPQLRCISTNPRTAMAVEISSGYLQRYGEDQDSPQGNLIKIQEGEEDQFDIGVKHNASDPKASALFRLNPVDEHGSYSGMPSLSDTNQLEVKHFLSYKGRVLQIITQLHQANTDRSTSVNWIHSADAVAGATHLHNQTIPAFAEKQLPLRWHEQNVWNSIGVVATNEAGREPLNGELNRRYANIYQRTHRGYENIIEMEGCEKSRRHRESYEWIEIPKRKAPRCRCCLMNKEVLRKLL